MNILLYLKFFIVFICRFFLELLYIVLEWGLFLYCWLSVWSITLPKKVSVIKKIDLQRLNSYFLRDQWSVIEAYCIS